MRDGGYLVVIAQWSEHLQLKQRALTEFNCQWQPAFYFFFYWLVPANMSCLFVCLFVCQDVLRPQVLVGTQVAM